MGRSSSGRHCVLVDKNGQIYSYDDFYESFVMEFESEEDAQEELNHLIEEEVLDANDGWHPEWHRN